MNKSWPYVTHGIPDNQFIRGQVPMTKEEVRSITLSKARLAPEHVVWDIGAGTGSISIEAALLAARGHVYAIERNSDGIELIEQNMRKFEVTNLSVVFGEAPEALVDLPRPNRIIIGGSGGSMQPILELACKTLLPDGLIICNSILLETASEFLAFFAKDEDYQTETVQIGITRVEPVGGRSMLKANNPIFVQVAQRRR